MTKAQVEAITNVLYAVGSMIYIAGIAVLAGLAVAIYNATGNNYMATVCFIVANILFGMCCVLTIVRIDAFAQTAETASASAR